MATASPTTVTWLGNGYRGWSDLHPAGCWDWSYPIRWTIHGFSLRLSYAVSWFGLFHPVMDGLSGGFELLGQFFRDSAGSDQLNDLLPEFSRIRGSGLGHGGLLLLKGSDVHHTGSTSLEGRFFVKKLRKYFYIQEKGVFFHQPGRNVPSGKLPIIP